MTISLRTLLKDSALFAVKETFEQWFLADFRRLDANFRRKIIRTSYFVVRTLLERFNYQSRPRFVRFDQVQPVKDQCKRESQDVVKGEKDEKQL